MRSDAASQSGHHDSQAVAETALRRQCGARLRSRLASTAGSAAAMARRGQPRSVQQHQSFVGQSPHDGLQRRRSGRFGDDALRCQSMLGQHIRRQQAAALAGVRRNAAQQTGDAVGGTERPQRLRIGCAEQTRRRRPPAPPAAAEQIGAPVLQRLESPAPPRPRARRSAPADRRDRGRRPRSRRAAVRRPHGGGARPPPPRATIAAGSAPAAAPTPPRAPAPVRG